MLVKRATHACISHTIVQLLRNKTYKYCYYYTKRYSVHEKACRGSASASRNLSIVSNRDPENTPEYFGISLSVWQPLGSAHVQASRLQAFRCIRSLLRQWLGRQQLCCGKMKPELLLWVRWR